MTETIADTAYGKVRGYLDRGIHAFRGIPYGGPTGGPRRFLPPSPPQPWAGIRPAQEWGPLAPQRLPSRAATPLTLPMFPGEPFVFDPRDQPVPSEDCLTLNVWTPELGDGARRPVLVWLHAGAWRVGTSAGVLTHGTALARRGDAVVVSVNHRIASLGYLHLRELAGEEFALSGHAGLLDLVLALEWVRENVAAFGGDPSRVTIFGHSGGSLKATSLLVMPRARGLFRAAGALSAAGPVWLSGDEATLIAERIMHELGLAGRSGVEQLQRLPWTQVIEAQEKVLPGVAGPTCFGQRLRLTPPVAGETLPDPLTAIAAGAASDVALITGTTAEEGAHFYPPGFVDDVALRALLRGPLGEHTDRIVDGYRALRPDHSATDLLTVILADHLRMRTIDLAERKLRGGGRPAYLSLLTWKSPVLGKAAHGFDMPFIFDTVDLVPPHDGTESRALAERMSSTWLAYAHHGEPNGAGLPTWPAYSTQTRDTMVFDVDSRVEQDPFGEERRLWADVPYVPAAVEGPY